MTSYLLDADWIIDCLHGQTPAVETLVRLAADGLAVSHITYGEVYEGAYYARDPSAALAGMADFLRGKVMLAVTLSIIERFAVLRGSLPRQLRNQIGDMDLLVAATALEHDLTLLTRNLRDFQHIPQLRIYEPPGSNAGDDPSSRSSTYT